MCEMLVGDGTDCPYLPQVPLYYSSTSSSISWAAQPGSWGPNDCLALALTTASCPQLRLGLELWLQLELNSASLELQLTQTLCGTWLYNCFMPTCFLWASYLHRIQPVLRSRWYSDIFHRMHLFLDWRRGRRSICYISIYLSIWERKRERGGDWFQQELECTLLKPDCHSWWISKMQSDTLEERYAITFCFKLRKNATETYGMLQTSFGASCMNRASVFEWHKRFKEGRESLSDYERCVRSKEVNTPELIGQGVRVRVRVSMLRFWGSSWRDSVGRGQHSSNRVNDISTRTMQ